MKTYFQKQIDLLQSQIGLARQGFMRTVSLGAEKLKTLAEQGDCEAVYRWLDDMASNREALAELERTVSDSSEYYKGLVGEALENA